MLPPPYVPPSAKRPGEPTPGLSVPRNQAINVPRVDPEAESKGSDVVDPELLETARDLVKDLLGGEALAEFDKAETPRDRSVIMQEAAYAQVMGPEMFAATRDMEPQMRSLLFNSMSKLQSEGLHANEKFSEGLNKALTEQVYTGDNEDGTRGTTRTALFGPLSILEAELYQANQQEWGKEARDRVQNKMTRALIIAGMEAAGEEVNDAADVVFARPDGTEVRINDEGDLTEAAPAD